MNTHKTWIFGLATLGLALATPVQASPDFMDGAFIVAKNERGDEIQPDPRAARKDEQPREEGKRRGSRREAKRDEPEGYGYGYERRRQHHEAGSRSRDRR